MRICIPLIQVKLAGIISYKGLLDTVMGYKSLTLFLFTDTGKQLEHLVVFILIIITQLMLTRLVLLLLVPLERMNILMKELLALFIMFIIKTLLNSVLSFIINSILSFLFSIISTSIIIINNALLACIY